MKFDPRSVCFQLKQFFRLLFQLLKLKAHTARIKFHSCNMIMNIKQRKIKIEPRINLNYNIVISKKLCQCHCAAFEQNCMC